MSPLELPEGEQKLDVSIDGGRREGQILSIRGYDREENKAFINPYVQSMKDVSPTGLVDAIIHIFGEVGHPLWPSSIVQSCDDEAVKSIMAKSAIDHQDSKTSADVHEERAKLGQSDVEQGKSIKANEPSTLGHC